MGCFWEKSREYLREEELYAEFEAAEKARDDAGKAVLMCVATEIDTPRNAQWLEARRGYLDAQAVFSEVFKRWCDARQAFEVSSAGKAKARYFADPLAARFANGPASYAPAETEGTAS